ncbi:glucoamylase, partial [Tremellales sp. Uapishka_1]
MVAISSLVAVFLYWSYPFGIYRQETPDWELHLDTSGQDNLTRWIQRETPLALNLLLSNIGPPAGAKDGLIIASPSRSEPDYYYTWTRDSALTISSLLPLFLPEPYLQPWKYIPLNSSSPAKDPLYEPLIRDYIASQAAIQDTSNPSGDLWSGGLSEPKFNTDGTAFTGNWGRPQRDGPALRALSLIPYAHFLLDRGWPSDVRYIKDNLYDGSQLRSFGNVIKNDLEEVAHNWPQPGFDLWEEVNGHHLFTLVMSSRAFEAGSILASRLDDPLAAEYYDAQVALIDPMLRRFWDPEKGIWRATLRQDDRTGLDCAFALTTIWTADRPSDPEILSTVYQYIKSFQGVYGLNKQSWVAGWGVGRYKEDVYDGVGKSKGNPWYICTFSAAHTFYLMVQDFRKAGQIEVVNITLPFWADVLEGHLDVTVGDKWMKGDDEFQGALDSLRTVGDNFVEVGRRYAPEGRMSEQFDRTNGSPIGARDLTWSYASFLEMARARERVV